MNSRYVIKAKTMKFPEENRETSFYCLNWQRFLRVDTESTNYNRKFERLDLIKMKNVCALNDIIKKIKKQATNW